METKESTVVEIQLSREAYDLLIGEVGRTGKTVEEVINDLLRKKFPE